MVAINPDNVRAAATHVRLKGHAASELEATIRSASILSHLDASSHLTACTEIGEELSLLATILTARAEEAAGFYLVTSGWDLTPTLIGSLLDGVGSAPNLTAPLALHLLMTQASHHAVDGSNPTSTNDPFDALVFTIDDLRRLADDPNTPAELATAAAFLVTNPNILELTRAWEGTGALLPSHGVGEFPLRDIEAFLARNDLLRQMLGPFGVVAPNTINDHIDDDMLIAAGIDPDQFTDLALPRNGHDLLIAAINHGTFNTNPAVARAFIQTMPVHYLDGHSIDITTTDGDAIRRLYEAATIDLSTSKEDFAIRGVITAFLPESTAGVRNELISSNYAELAHWHGVELNGTTPATDPMYKGNNWFHLGVAASYSVAPVIENELRTLATGPFPGFATPAAVDQDVADGNQAIYHHFITGQAAQWDDQPTGSPLLDEAFDLLEQAALTDDIADAQLLVAQSTVLFAIEEQVVVDPYLQLDGLSIIEEAGTLLATGVPATALTVASNGLITTLPRNADQVMTDEGQLTVQVDGEDLIPPIDISGPVPPSTHSNNTVDAGELAARLPDDFDWLATEADSWPDLDQRMPIIFDVALAGLTEPAYETMVADQLGGHLGAPR